MSKNFFGKPSFSCCSYDIIKHQRSDTVQRIPLSELKVGMVVARAITNESGMVLLSEGTALTESLIVRLGRMDLSHIFIRGASSSDKSKAELLSELDHRFKKTEKEPYMHIIKGVIKARIEEVYQ